MSANSKLYVIRRDLDEWTPIVAIINAPKTPALSTMIKRFNEAFAWPKPLRKDAWLTVNDIIAENEAIGRAQQAGYVGIMYAELFVDWLLKTDKRFERVDYQEVSI